MSQSMNSVWSNSLSLNYERFTLSGSKDIGQKNMNLWQKICELFKLCWLYNNNEELTYNSDFSEALNSKKKPWMFKNEEMMPKNYKIKVN